MLQTYISYKMFFKCIIFCTFRPGDLDMLYTGRIIFKAKKDILDIREHRTGLRVESFVFV